QVRLFLPERRSEVPALTVRPLPGGGHVLRIALGRTGIYPADDGLDLVVGERSVVLELLNTDAPIDLPRRHLAVADSRLDRARPRPRLTKGHERHRRDRVGAVTCLALLLEDRRDVLG